MCVAVTLAPNAQLTLEELSKMDRANKDGVGVAWAEDGMVHWLKTTKVDVKLVLDVLEATAGFNRLLHFRLSTAGGIEPGLCHPFEIGPLAAYAPRGSSSKVMIHNGHWGGWQEMKHILSRENLLPPGPWSDTRLAAFLASEDEEWLEALGGKVAVMTGDGTTRYLGEWQDLREGIKVSNKGWEFNVSRGGYAGYHSWPGWEANDKQEEKAPKKEEKGKRNEQEPVVCWQDKEGFFRYWNQQTRQVFQLTVKSEKSAIEEARAGRGTPAKDYNYATKNYCSYAGSRNCGYIEKADIKTPCSECDYKGC